MAVYGKRNLSAVISYNEYVAVRPALKVGQVGKLWDFYPSDFGSGMVHISIDLHGSYYHLLDEVFSAYVANWEKM